MKDYVSRQAVIEAMMKASTPAFDENGKPTFLVDYVKTMECLPSADVVEVIRCKDCISKDKAKVNSRGFLICPDSGMEICDDDYCSYGEARENDTH